MKAGELDARAIEPLIASRVLVVILDPVAADSARVNNEVRALAIGHRAGACPGDVRGYGNEQPERSRS
ncbi:hypothetical protein [Granulicoccus sp. GXG6511]|uniref:hypothetical protein n=1 Tax=Granulicoccus sp. GXG6511 TaxID=3381351 RepID=UPI003D7C68E4